MKKATLLILLIGLGFNQFLSASTKDKVLKSNIKKVTVFLQGAQVERSASQWLEKGTYKLVFSNLSDQLNPASIQVNGKGEMVIMSVNHQLNYLKNAKESKQVIVLKDSLKILREDVELESTLLKVLNDEESFLQTNKSIGGQQQGVKIEDLIAATEFYRTKMKEIRLQKLKINRKVAKINKNIQRINNQLSTLNANKNKHISEIVVTVNALKATTAKLVVKYVVSNAGWIPNYDIRVDRLDKPLKLSYKAKVFQRSGEDWNNVKLNLSTANPNKSNVIPNLPVWWLNYYTPAAYRGEANYQWNTLDVKQEKASDDMDGYMEAKGTHDYTTMVENNTNTEFQISLPYSIASDGKFYDVDIQEHKLEATYQYYAAPKLDRDAFLKARITGWEQYNLLPGETNLYFEGTYVGKAQIATRRTDDTLDISLGRDKNIAITRIKRKEFCKKKFLGNQQKETLSWEINVRNKKSVPIDIVIEDHFPVSKIADIKVDVKEKSNGDYNEETGKIKWRYQLQPSASKKMILGYEVTFPKGRQLNLN